MERITEVAKADRPWHTDGGEPEDRRHREDLERLARVLGGTDTGRLRYWAGVTMIDGRWCGASGTGVYKVVDLTRGLSACVAGPRRCPATRSLAASTRG